MAWNDETTNIKRGPVRQAIDLQPLHQIIDERTDSLAQVTDDSTQRIRIAGNSASSGPREFEPAEFAMNSQTGEIALPNGQVVKANAPTILQLATLKSKDGSALPHMQSVPEGFRPVSQAEMKRIVDAIPTESDFWGEAFASGKTTLGLMASAIDAMYGSDDPNNSWSDASQDHANDQSIGQLKASQGRWYSDFDSFLNSLGQTTGNIAGTAVGAIPGAVAGAAAGAPAGGVGAAPGALVTAGLALSGGLSTFGEQAADFYPAAVEAMTKMSPEELERNSPLYRKVVSENPGITHDDAIRQVAIEGARAAGGTAGVLGAAEAMIGGKLAGNFLARMGVTKSLLGAPMDAVAKRSGALATTGRVAGRAALGGGAAAAEEMGETMLGQAAGASTTGIGSTNPLDYANADEGWDAALGGILLGAVGGRARQDPTQVAQNSDLAAALAVNPDVNQPWNQSRQLTAEQDLVPAAMRRQIGQAQTALQPLAAPAPDQRQLVMQQLTNVIAERFGPDWFDRIDQVAQDPAGRQLVGQLMAIERDIAGEQEQPAYERGYGQPPVPQGQPQLTGPAFGDGTAPPAPQPASVPRGEPPAPNLAERRAFQQIQQAEAARASEQNPALLPQAASRGAEQRIFELEDKIDELEAAIAQRPARDPRKRFLKQALADLNAQLRQAEQEWQDARLDEGPSGVLPGARVDSPEPMAAPGERTPDGRPVGVTPAALENPEPMSPQEAASRAQTQQERRAGVGDVATAAASSMKQVSPSTVEPVEDIAAQVEAMVDPASERDAVFVAEQQGAATQLPKLPKGVMRVERPGVGVLLTTNKQKAQEFRTKKLTDAKLQQILGYSENKADVIAKGEEPVVVQARTKSGAVAAEQLATRKGVPAAKKAVAKQGPKGAKVIETSIAKAQERRAAAMPPKAAAAVATSKAPKDKKTRVHKKKDDDDSTRAERTLKEPGAPRPAEAPAVSTADVVERAAQRKPEAVTSRGQTKQLPTKLARRTGTKGVEIDLRVDSIDEDARFAVGRLVDGGVLSAPDRAKAETVIRDFDQLESMLNASVTAAEEKLRKVFESEGISDAFTREAEQRQLEVERTATSGERGRPRETPRTSPIAYLPLTLGESRGFLQALRSEAKAELKAGYQPAQSVARQMISGIHQKWDSALLNEVNGRKALKVFAELTDAQIEDVLQSTHQLVQDSTVAKQVMRGATEVAHAIRRMEQDMVGSRTIPDFANHEVAGVENKVLPHSTEHGELPEAARGVVNEWARQFERGGNKFSAPIHVMSIKDAMKVAPGAFLGGRVPNGKFIRRTDAKGNPTDYILAVDWPRFKFEGAALEVLAHEFGHLVTTELYARTDVRTRAAIDKAYDNWRRAQHGRSVDDILRDEMPGIERITFSGGVPDGQRAYAENFWEWAARNAALYVLDPNRPHVSAIEKFFKAIADVMRRIYAQLKGSQPNEQWAEALDRWISGSMQVSPMPTVPGATYNHEEFADNVEPPQRALVDTMVRKATSSLAPLRDVFSGKASKQDVADAMRPIVEGKQFDLLKQLGLSLETMRQIERQYRETPLGPALSGWVRNQQLKAKTANTAMEAGSQWMERANQLDAKIRTVLEQIMYQATHFGVHPELALTDKKNAHLLRGSDYVQQINEQRYRAANQLYNAAVKADPRVAEIYAGLRDSFTELHEKTLAKQLELVQNANFTDKAKEQIVERIKAAQRQMREGPYFPLMRFGDWIVKVQLPAYVVGKDGKENGTYFDSKTAAREEMRNQRAVNPGAQVTTEAVADEPGKYLVRVYQRGVYFYESEAAAKAAAKDIEKEVRENYASQGVSFDEAQAAMEPHDDGDGHGETSAIISQPFKGREGYERTKAGSPEFMQEVRSLVSEKKLDPEVAATLERLAIESLPENNYRQSLLPRQNIFGASKQMLRSYAHRYQGAAHHFSTVEHGAQINKNWQRAWEVNRTYSPAGRVLNALQANQAAVAERMKPTLGNAVMNTITDASSLFSLGFSPAYVLTNALQPWTVAMPTMAGLTQPNGSSVGMTKATKYLKAAYEGAVPFFTKRGIGDFINEAKALAGKRGDDVTLQDTAKQIISAFGKTEGEQRMLESLLERGTLDFSWLNSLEDAMRGGKVGQKWANLQRLGMAFPQQVEAMNRVTTALAAYRLAKDERLTDGSEAALQEFADDMVADTQLDYSRMNRPLAFNKAGLNVILQFKLYMQGMYMLFVRNAAMAWGKGRTPEERKQGRRTMAYLLASHAAAAGAAGLGPAAFMAKMALVAFAAMTPDDDDDWKSGEQLMHELLADLFGEYAGTVAEKGLPAILGVDMSDRIGLPVLADSRFAQIRESDSAGTTMDKWVIYGLGAPYANFKRASTGAIDLAKGDYSSAMNGLPAAARSIARSAKWMKEGIVDRDGDTFIPNSELAWGDLAINTLGLSPMKTSRAYSDRTELKQTTARIINERKRLLQAARTGEDVSDEIDQFNAAAPRPFRITGEQIQKSKKAKGERERGALRKEEAAVKDLLDQ